MTSIETRMLSFMAEKGLIEKKRVEDFQSLGESPERLSLEEHLIHSGLLTPEQYRHALEEFFGVPLASEEDYPKEPALVNHLSFQFMKASKVVPARLENKELTVIMSNPLDFYTIDAIRMVTDFKVQVLAGRESEILETLDRYYGLDETSMGKIIEDMESIPEYRMEEEESIDHLRDMASEGPVIRLVNLIISRAIEMRASDIHCEPFENQFRVRYRIDGVLHDVESPPKRLQAAIISRVKIMAKLNIAERRLPQDGRIMLRVKGKEIDFRVSSLPTIHGEGLVLRILDKGSILLDIE